MRTTRLPITCVLVATTRCQYKWEPGHTQPPLDISTPWTYSPLGYSYPPDILIPGHAPSPGHNQPLLVTPGGYHWIHTPLWTDRHL